MKHKLKGLHRSKYNRLADRIREARMKLTDVQQRVHDDPHNTVLQQLEKQYYAEFTGLAKAEIALYQQKVKEEWLHDMDSNTAFFHARMKEKHSAVRIKRLINAEGDSVETEEGIAQQFIEFYSQLYGSSNENLKEVEMELVQRGKVLDDEQAEQLCKEVTNEEIRAAIFSISSNKAPGSDGFGAGFFKDA